VFGKPGELTMRWDEIEPKRTNEAVRKARSEGPGGEELFDVAALVSFARQLEFELELTIADRDRRYTQARTLSQQVMTMLKLVIATREGRAFGEDVVRFAEVLRDAKRVADTVFYGDSGR